MKERDKNTSFFHRTTNVHNAHNKILRLQNEEGVIVEDYDQVKYCATKVDIMKHLTL